ncbi:MAG: hypothetical protein ACJ0Q2_04080 [Candidatus Azotimanducaceae bacterium]
MPNEVQVGPDDSKLRLLEVTKFCAHVYKKDYDNALRSLVQIAIPLGLDRLSGGEDLAEPATEYAQKLISLSASGITALICDPQFHPNEVNFRNLVALRGIFRRIFRASHYQDMSHFHGLLGDLRGKTAVIRPENLTKSFLIITLNTMEPHYFTRIERMGEDIQAIIWLSLMDNKDLFLDKEQESLDRLIDLVDLIRATSFRTTIEVGLAAKVWFYCTYWDNPRKHEVKAFINRCLLETAKTHDYFPEAVFKESQPKADRKVILVVLEHWHKGHAMYRCYSKSFHALSSQFKLVALGSEENTRPDTMTMFEEVITHPNDISFFKIKETVEKILELQPDAIFYSSVGMCPTSLQLAQFRLAPIQMMSGGHPASSFSKEMDYLVLDAEFMPSPLSVSEKLVAAENGSMTSFVRLSEFVPSKRPSEKKRVRVVVNSTYQKITPRFLKICQQIEKKTSRSMTFSFLIGADVVNQEFLEKVLKGYLEDPIVYRSMHYEDYLTILSNNDLQLVPFPFGNTNGFIDAMICGLPTLCLVGEGLESVIDSAMSKKMSLPEFCRAKDRDEYISSAKRLIENDMERDDIAKHIREADLEAILFFKIEKSERDFPSLVQAICQNHESVKGSEKGIISIADILRDGSQ